MLEQYGMARTGIYIKDDIKFRRRPDLEVKGDSMIWITIHPHRQPKFNLCNFYRQWQIVTSDGKISQITRIEKYAEKIQISIAESETICCQDTNLDLSLPWDRSDQLNTYDQKLIPVYKTFKNQILDKGLSYIKTEPTKVYHDRPYSAIDHLLTTNPAKIVHHQVIKEGYSDHLPVIFTRISKNPTQHPRYYFHRDFSKVDWDEMNAEIKNDPEYFNALISQDSNTVAQLIIELINGKLETTAPLKKTQYKTKLPSFTTQDTKTQILSRDSALQKARDTGHPDDIRNYKHLRNLSHKLITKDKNQHIKDKLSEAQDNNDDKKLWSRTKDVLGWNKNKAPNILVHQGKTITNSKEIANTLNREQIIRNIRLRRNVPYTPTNPMNNYDKITIPIKQKLKIKEINMYNLRHTLDNIKSTGSSGFDTISTRTIKNLRKSLEPLLLNLVNTTITSKKYPEILKLSKAVPILKQGKPYMDPLSYRAVNLLPTLSKIIDRVVSQQTTEFLLLNNIIPIQHHGGVKGKSTITAIMTEIDDWSEKVERGEELAIIIIDQSAAYDTIDHELLLKKMEKLGFSQDTIEYFTNYLNQRRQQIHIEGTISDELHIGKMSVVQGSTLSCLLYLIYTMDLPLLFQESRLNMEQELLDKNPKSNTYVDDTTTTIQLNQNTTYQNQIDNTVTKMNDYMNSNFLTMNDTKTQLFIISKDINTKDKLRINTINKTIKPTNTFKYLGMHISNNLTWNQHISEAKDSLIKQLNTRINAIKLLKKHLDTKTLTKIANGIIYSKLLYGIEVWGAAPDYLTKKVQTTIMKAARTIVGTKSYRWSNNKTLQEIGWLSVEQQITLTAAKTGHKIIHKGIPETMAHKIMSQRTEIITRMSGPNKLGPRPKNYGGGIYTRNQTRAKIYKHYNKIPDAIIDIKDHQKFKNWTKKYLFNPRIQLPKTKTPIN